MWYQESKMFHKSTLRKQKQNHERDHGRKGNIPDKALEIILIIAKSGIYSINIIDCLPTSGTVMIGDW